MRIAYVCADRGIPVWGCKGASVHVQGILGALARSGHEVVLLAARNGGAPPPPLSGVRVVPLQGTDSSEPGFAAAIVRSNGELLDRLESLGGIEAVYERYSLWSFAGMEFARRRNIPGILEVNAPLIDEQSRHRSLTDRAGAERVACRAFAAASTIVAVSREVAAYVDAHPCSQGAAHVVPNGIDPTRFATRPPARDPNAPFTLGFLGTLKPWHGLETLVRVFAAVHTQLPHARLVVIGDGPERDGLQRWLREAGLAQHTTFTGALAPEYVPHWLGELDVALAPYPADAPFYFSPLKVVEYMAAGLPVVASEIGQMPELIESGVTGLLAPAGDVARFVSCCLELAHDRARARAIGDAARAVALRDRTWDATLARILQIAAPAASDLQTPKAVGAAA